MINNLFLTIFATQFAFVISEGTWVVIIGQVGVVATLLIKMWVDRSNRIQDRLDKEEDRKYMLALATLSEAQQEIVLKSGQDREKRIVGEIRDTRQAVKEAVVEGKNIPQQVEVVNTTSHPVPVKTD